ncbi:matrixin family metalloprotease [Marine Group I thaumarchaeote]|uniref:Matrixin family metalloprotease n=1 Tax=Marine Group I thaumarchaeote TaxID=2511932 RepID=A0A7K4N614_9ARCH|nr:matrixin family metalloprotease [Marine Group I thaumarchaeote]NWJ83670.1 matrixin family metalloprotease [Marine Group I thaumarchaeote]NWK01275.1 matrixin family metalloprotease [Marine Group I thaumarchaeote]
MKKNTMIISYFLVIILLSSPILNGTVFAQTEKDPELMFNQAKEHFINGEYKQAIKIFDDILEISPNNISTLKMKGIVLSNLEQHDKSLKQFFKVLQFRSNDVISLTGMGVGFGYLGEYQEAIAYFDKALKEKPDSVVIKNYKEFIEKVIIKYPYIPTEKPKGSEKVYVMTIPEWVKPIAKWWSEGNIDDSEFISALLYLIENKIIQIPPVEIQSDSEDKIPEWVKTNARKWAYDKIDDNTFVSGIQHMIEYGLITVNVQNITQSQEELDYELYLFGKYLRDISNNIVKEIRYIEYPNPSQDVIKKFLRDYIKWNFEEQAKLAAETFPNPTYEIIDEVVIVYYKVFINNQPPGLPLDHVYTLKSSFLFWEEQEFDTNNEKAKVKFEITNLRHEANVWVTWIVRNIGEGVLGHAHLGKGIVEVTLGDYNCDASFQLYDVKSVETIMTHELGHSVGLQHVTDQNNIMYASYTPSYAYCLLS